MRPLTLSAIDGGINRLRLKGGANKDALYDLLNGYVTNAGTVKVRPGTLRNVDLSATTGAGMTKGLVAYQGTKHVFSHQQVPVPSGYTLHVLNHPAGTQTSSPVDPTGGVTRPYTVPSLAPFSNVSGFADSGNGTLTWTPTGVAISNAVLDPFGNNTGVLYVDGSTHHLTGTGATGFNLVDGTKDWTIEFWHYSTDASSGSGGGGTILTLLDFSDSSARFGTIEVNGIQVTFTPYGGAWGGGGSTLYNNNFQGPNVWNHIAVVKSGEVIRLYVNGDMSTGVLPFANIAGNPGSGTIANYYIGNKAIGGFANPGKGYYSNFRITFSRGVYCGNSFFTPAAALTTTVNFPYNAASLQHYESNSPAFLDSVFGGETWTAGGSGGTASQTATQAKFGTQSLTFSGADAYISAPLLKNGQLDFLFRVPDYTFDFWIYSPTATPASAQNIINFTNAAPTMGLNVKLLTNGKIRASFPTVSGTTTLDSAAAITANAWHHVAVVMYGATAFLFLDGVGASVGFFLSGSLPTSANNATIGSAAGSGAGFSGGYVDEFRITIGLAIWISNFTPPTAPGIAQTISPIPIKEIHFAAPYLGFLYVVAEFQPDTSGLGSVFHYWLQVNGTWAPSTDYRIGDVVVSTSPNGLLFTASRKTAPNPVWAPNVQHQTGDLVEPTVPNGFYFDVTAVQGSNPTSGNTEPTWPTADGATVTENSQLANDQSISVVTSAPQPPTNAPSTTTQTRYKNIAGGFNP